MRAVALALACLLRFATSAHAQEIAHPHPPASIQPGGVSGGEPQRKPSGPQGDQRDKTAGAAKAGDKRDQHTSNGPPSGAEVPAPFVAKIKLDTQHHDDPRLRRDASRQDIPHQETAHLEIARREAPRARICFGPAETRDNVAAHRLAEPFRALRAGRQQGEALRAKLCRWKQDQFVYEIFVLRRDGRIVRVYMNAQNGQAVGALEDR